MAGENVTKHKIVVSGEQEYKRAMRDMTAQLKEAKSEVKATSAEMDAQGKSTETLTAQMVALQRQHELENEMLREMQRHLEAVVEATGEESREAVTLRTRINAMRTEVAQTTSQMSGLTSEMSEAAGAASGLGDSAAADGIRGLGGAAEEAEGTLGGLSGILQGLGDGVEIGLGVSIGQGTLDMVAGLIRSAIQRGWNEAMENQRDYNTIGIQTGTAGSATNDYMARLQDRLKLKMPNRSMGDINDAIASAYTFLPTEVFEDEERLIDLLTRADAVATGTGDSIAGVVENARQLNTVFGTGFEDSMALLYSSGTGKQGAGGVDALVDNAIAWRDLGMSAEQASGTLESAANLGVTKMGDVGKAVKEASGFLSDFTGNKDDLKAMGLLATDLGTKFQAGGDQAAAAMQVMLRQFMELSPEMQEQYGPKMFGTKAWESYGSAVAEAMLLGYESSMSDDQRAAVDAAVEAMTDDLGSQVAIAQEHLNQNLGEAFAGDVDMVTQALKAGNANAFAMDAAGGDWVDVEAARIAGTAKDLGQRLSERSEEYMEDALGADWRDMSAANLAGVALGNIGEWANGTFSAIYEGANDALTTAGDAVGNLTAPIVDKFMQMFVPDVAEPNAALKDQARQHAESLGSEAAETYAEGLAKGAAMADALTGADYSGWLSGVLTDMALAEADMAAEEAEAAEAAARAGEATGEAMGDALTEEVDAAAEEAGNTVAERVRALNEAIAAAYDMGDPMLAESLKEERDALIPEMMALQTQLNGVPDAVEVTMTDTATGAVTSLTTGLAPLPGVAQDSVDGLAGVLGGAKLPAYDAGFEAGNAFQQGYRDALDIRSPSHVMEALAEQSLAGLERGLSSGGPDLVAQGAALGNALSYGTARTSLSSPSAQAGVDAAGLRDAMSGLAVVIDDEIAGRLLDLSVSRAGYERAAGTVTGRAGKVRGW